jgi:hypothetical protein
MYNLRGNRDRETIVRWGGLLSGELSGDGGGGDGNSGDGRDAYSQNW